VDGQLTPELLLSNKVVSGVSFWGPRGLPLDVRVRKEIKVADRAEILSILQGAKSEHIEYM
jgi:hypothetical protein